MGAVRYGILKTFSVKDIGGYMDGKLVNPGTGLKYLDLGSKPYISLKIAVKDDAKHIGGINIFGEKYGDYPQGIIMNLTHQ